MGKEGREEGFQSADRERGEGRGRKKPPSQLWEKEEGGKIY